MQYVTKKFATAHMHFYNPKIDSEKKEGVCQRGRKNNVKDNVNKVTEDLEDPLYVKGIKRRKVKKRRKEHGGEESCAQS